MFSERGDKIYLRPAKRERKDEALNAPKDEDETLAAEADGPKRAAVMLAMRAVELSDLVRLASDSMGRRVELKPEWRGRQQVSGQR